jgi:hypothetical protein
LELALQRLAHAWPRRKPEQAPSRANTSPTQLHRIGRQRWLFGLRWQPLSADADLAQELSKHKAQGARAYALTYDSELLGLSDTATPKGTCAAALTLAEHHSNGGSELFLFQFEQDHALIALNQSLPVPGFDLWGSKSAIKAAAKLYTDIHGEQHVRQVGNVQGWSGIQHLSPETAFAEPVEHAEVKSFQSLRELLPLVLVALLLGLGFVGYTWYETVQEEQRRAMAVPEDPNIVYERTLRSAMQGLAPAGMGAIHAWSMAVGKQPLRLAGWSLTQVKCRLEVCQMTWRRDYGNYLDFSNAAQTQLGATASIEKSKELNDSTVSTTHPIGLSDVTRIDRQSLPHANEARKLLGAQLQDMLLLGASQAVMTDPSLFGGQGSGANLAGLRKPVLKGEFKIEGQLWMLNDLALPTFAVPEGIEVNFLPSNSADPQQIVSTKFVLTGGYFANSSKQ